MVGLVTLRTLVRQGTCVVFIGTLGKLSYVVTEHTGNLLCQTGVLARVFFLANRLLASDLCQHVTTCHVHCCHLLDMLGIAAIDVLLNEQGSALRPLYKERDALLLLLSGA